MFAESSNLDWFFKPLFSTDKVTRYPLTNVGYDKDDNLFIEIALAGFKKENIKIEIVDNQIYIKGKKPKKENELEYVQKHISSNEFERVFVLAGYYVNGKMKASVEDGILTIKIEPSEPPKKLLEIN